MNKINIYIAILSLGLLLTSCDSFLDVNDNPNRATSVSLAALLPTTIEGTSSAHYSIAYTTSQLTQHTGSVFGYPDMIRVSGAWSTIYLKNMTNLDQIITMAAEENSPHYAGAAKVLMAINLGLLTDLYEDVPYTEALGGSENLIPSYDSQQSIYENILALLDEGISDLSAGTSVFTLDKDDLAYAGDLSKWIKLGHSVRARYAYHILGKGAAAAEVLSSLTNGIQSNEDDFQLFYNSVNFNPWHQFVALANNTGNLSLTLGAQFINTLNGSIHGVVDPRLPLIADKGTSENYVGISSFIQDSPTYTVDFSETTYYSTQGAPIQMVTSAEMKFIEADIKMQQGDMAGAYEAYLQGIEAHMTKVGVSLDDMNTYLSDPTVAVGAANLSLNNIMKEKYIAMFLNPESWVDLRKYNYSDDVFEGFIIPDPNLFNGPVQRSLYPQDEFNRNSTNVTAVEKEMETPMWRDQ